MAKKQVNARNIIAIVGLVLLVVAVIGLVAYFTKGFSTNVFYIKVNGEIVSEATAGYLTSREAPLNVEVKEAFDVGEESPNYFVEIKANEEISFTYSVDGVMHTFNNDIDWNSLFYIEQNENGFLLIPKADCLDELLGEAHGGSKVEFALPDEVLNIFCMTISSEDASKQYKVYFSLPQVRTGIVLSEKEMVF